MEEWKTEIERALSDPMIQEEMVASATKMVGLLFVASLVMMLFAGGWMMWVRCKIDPAPSDHWPSTTATILSISCLIGSALFLEVAT
jgi:uncharacterized membrane protein YqhA